MGGARLRMRIYHMCKTREAETPEPAAYERDDKMQVYPRQQRVPIGGVPVLFPFKPYPSQRAMMAKVIQSLNQGANALLESPTGSGKSLALLCSSLAWVTQQRDVKAACAPCGCVCHSNAVPTPCQNGIKTEPSAGTSCWNGIKTEPSAGTSCWNGIKTEPSAGTSCWNGIKTESKPSSGPVPIPYQNGIKMELSTDTSCQNGIKAEASVVTQNGTEPCNESSMQPYVPIPPADSLVGGAKGVADTTVTVGGAKGVAGPSCEAELDEDFRRPKKRYRTPGGVANSVSKKSCVKSEVDVDGEGEEAGPSSWRIEVEAKTVPAYQQPSVMDTGLPTSPHPPPPTPAPPPCQVCACAKSAGLLGSTSSVPKVYFGTRTHQQISQITHELAKTAYTSTPMCILGSREHACIHPVVSKSKRKNDECKKLLEDGACSFYYRVAKKLGSQAQMLQHGMTTAWDMEDLVTLGKRVKACPYFAIRGIKEEAHIVFCPYNYLIDPLIRDQMLIELSGQVVVFDEAHNMEDAAREAASLSLTSQQLEDLVKEFTDILDSYTGKLRLSFEFLTGIGVSVKKWIDATISSLPRNGFDQTCGIWPGQDFIPRLKNMGIIDHTPAMIKSHLKAITDAVNEQKNKAEEGEESEYVPCPSTAAICLLKGLSMVLSYLFRQGQKFADDYRVSLMRTATTKPTDDGWRRRRRSRVMEKVWLYTLNLWCLNPSVAFSELSCAHSVILTSGTLSPLSSFSSELGMKFKIQLEATHVVPESQTLIRSISCGPHGRAILANYQNSETYEFQDEVGAVLRQVCQIVPSGVLCFFSSYKMLHKLSQRWQTTGLWGSIEQSKVIVTEPTGSNKAEFEAVMRQFYSSVNGNGHVTGALFLAVCRGKVSEGLDFSDHNARAVITVSVQYTRNKVQVVFPTGWNSIPQHQRQTGGVEEGVQ
jgi:Rad3-related DNA helicase